MHRKAGSTENPSQVPSQFSTAAPPDKGLRGTAQYQASTSIVGILDSATTAELVAAAVAGETSAGQRDQVTDCRSFLAIEARASTSPQVCTTSATLRYDIHTMKAVQHSLR